MPAGSHSFAEVLQGRRRSRLFGQPPQINWTSSSKTTDLRQLARGTPAADHASDAVPHPTSRDATRLGGKLGSSPQHTPLRATEQQLVSPDDDPEKRLSGLSVITSVRVPTSRPSVDRRSWYQTESGRSTPRPHTSGGPQVKDVDQPQASQDKIAERPRTSMSGRIKAGTRAERSAIQTADVDYHAALRRMEGQDPVAKRSNKLEKMFGGQAALVNKPSSSPNKRELSFDLMEDENEDEDEPTTLNLPSVPMKSPRRAPAKSPRFPHRPSNSIDRSMHNSSVASTANQDSDLTNLDSEIFSEDEDDASSFTSGLSSLTDDLDRRSQEPKMTVAVRPYASESEQPAKASSRINPTLANINTVRANQQTAPAPDATTAYDMLAMRSPTGVERHDFGVSRVPGLAKSSTEVLLGMAMERHFADLSRHPSSQGLSEISDDSDSALPPPVSLHREYLGPKFKNREEQKSAYRPKPKPLGPAPLTASASSPSLPRADGMTSSLSKPSTAVDLTTRPARLPPRAKSVASASTDYAGNGQRQGAGFSLKKLFSRKKEEKASDLILQPLRKITFDARGQKQVFDLNSSQRDISEFMLGDPEEVFGEPCSPQISGVRSRAYSTRSMSISSKGANQIYNNGQDTVRRREQGAPRRTAWK